MTTKSQWVSREKIRLFLTRSRDWVRELMRMGTWFFRTLAEIPSNTKCAAPPLSLLSSAMVVKKASRDTLSLAKSPIWAVPRNLNAAFDAGKDTSHLFEK